MANGGYGYNLYPIMPFCGPVYSTARIETATENAHRTVFGVGDWDTGTNEDRSSWFEVARDFVALGLNVHTMEDKASLDPFLNQYFFEVLKLSLNSPNLETP